ncbi:MAG: hypothetical protein EPO68_02600, partial [Planctomycetota bacterium]
MIGHAESGPVAMVLERLKGAKRSAGGHVALCPAHADTNRSLSLDPGADGRALLKCFAGCPTNSILAALGLREADLFERGAAREQAARKEAEKPCFLPAEAASLWANALARTRNDEQIEAERPVYAYLEQRGLAEAWESRLYGVIAAGMSLHVAMARWPNTGHRLIVPLYDASGRVTNVQARAIGGSTPKTLFPAGGVVKGTVFADERGLRVLRGVEPTATPVVIGEGLTDFLAMAIGSPTPVLSVPGSSFAAAALGAWVRGRTVVLAFDRDKAGDEAADAARECAYALGAARVRRV